MKKKSLSILHRYRDHLLEREQINLQEKLADENNQKARLLQLQARVKATHDAKASAKTVEELKSRMDRGESLFILDVRNPEEYQISRLAGSKLIPLPALPQRPR